MWKERCGRRYQADRWGGFLPIVRGKRMDGTGTEHEDIIGTFCIFYKQVFLSTESYPNARAKAWLTDLSML